MNLLLDIIQGGNKGSHTVVVGNRVECKDGFTVSVIAGGGAYCSPRPGLCFPGIDDGLLSCPQEPNGFMWDVPCTYPGPYFEVELGFPSAPPHPWSEWSEYAENPRNPTNTIYARVPVEMVFDLVDYHGGIK